MSHEISIQNGRAEMFSGNNVLPWHKLGTVVAGLLTSKEAIQAAHLDWIVAAVPIAVNGREQSMDDYQGIIRQDTGDCLGVMKSRYEIIQNSDCFDFADSLVADGQIRYETAGALRGGKQVWMLAKYNGEISINNDQHKIWLLLVTSHDGSRCLELAWVTERVVCANTLSIALRGKQNSIKIRHCTNWTDKRQEAQRVLGLTQDYFEQLKSGLSKLQSEPMTEADASVFTRLLFPAKDEKEVPTRTSNMRWGVERLFNRPSAGTYGSSRWDALNAVTDFADHQMTMREGTSRLESALMGAGQALKQRAFDLLTGEELTKALIDQKPFTPLNVGGVSDDFSRLMGN